MRSPMILLLASPVVALGLSACETHDLGKDCRALLGDADPADGGGTRVETAEVVAYDATFPCDELICVATDGRPGYCSKKCREDAGCPAGFECRVVQPMGSLANEKYCVWRRCETSAGCGDPEGFCCVPADSAEVGDKLKLCDFRERYNRCP